MKTRAVSGRILADELSRVLEQFKRVDEQAEQAGAVRKRWASAAHHLLHVLQELTGERAAAKLIDASGLADILARLPGIPGRKPVVVAEGGRQARARLTVPVVHQSPAVPLAAPLPLPPVADLQDVLAKGTRIQMLTGKYRGWTGAIRWIQASGSIVAYTVDLTSPEGASARNQVRHSGLGKTWAIVAAVKKAVPKPSGRRQTRGAAAPVATTVLPKGTEVRIVTGKYESTTGVIGYRATKGSTVNYTVYFTTKDGRRAHG